METSALVEPAQVRVGSTVLALGRNNNPLDSHRRGDGSPMTDLALSKHPVKAPALLPWVGLYDRATQPFQRSRRRFFRSLFRRAPEDLPAVPTVAGQPARVPPGLCVYAIGDIHGHADLLEQMHQLIATDAASLTPGTDRLIVYLGDYVDRGPESRRVIDLLIGNRPEGFRAVHLLGNHDAWLLGFLLDPSFGPTWLHYGGDVTLHSYGVRLGIPQEDLRYYRQLQADLRERMPRDHVDFLQRLDLSFESGDYLFVHAGVDPALPLDQQTADHLLWIREPFLRSRRDLGRVVVHGHTVESEPVVRANRVGIDTGAYWSGRLTCLVLEETNYRFLTND
jgi:serine/threonine protein phosphatase 1